jgi:prephenate dehydrogenase
MKQKVAIVGFGRFGQLLASLVKDEFDTAIVEIDEKLQVLAKKQDFIVIPFELLGKADVIMLAVPIGAMEDVLQQLAPLVGKDQVVMDFCSVKAHPAKLLKKYLPAAQTIASHPLFGPDSAKSGLEGLQVAFCPLHAKKSTVTFWKEFWQKKGVEVRETTPEAHDRDAAYSQAFTYSLARLILSAEIPKLVFSTRSFEAIKQVADLSANDTDQLYHDMLFYNPYFKEMKAKLEAAATKTLASLETVARELENPKASD